MFRTTAAALIGLGLGLWSAGVALAQQQCPTPNCLPWTYPQGFLTGSDSFGLANRRYIQGIQSRRDPRLGSTAIQTDCVKYDINDPRPTARGCDILTTKDRRLP